MSAVQKHLILVNRKGLHARAATQFVKVAAQFNATVKVAHNGATADGKSVMRLLILAAPVGSRIDLEVVGDDAEAALAALTTLIERGFGE
jgi:phosphocarrier protein HPr